MQKHLPSFDAVTLYERLAPAVVTLYGSLGIATGFLIQHLDSYLLITGRHVIQHLGGRINAQLLSGVSLSPKIVWVSRNIDFAVLSINKDELPSENPSLDLGSSIQLKPGDDCYAFGAPYGLSWSFTDAKVSQRRRMPVSYDREGNLVFVDFIQVSGFIFAGFSGGPLIDLQGKVVGVISTKLGDGPLGPVIAVPIDPVISELASFVNNLEHCQRKC
jgi:S1-C subfamily serine protease